MGIQESKQNFGSSPNLSTGSSRRSSLYKSGTIDQIQLKQELVRSIQSDIDIFAGNRSDERYKDLQQILIKTSTDLEQIKKKSNKERTRDRCDHVLREVQASIQRLEAKLATNEQTDKSLDLAAVETDSFVNQSFIKPSNQQYVRPEVVKSLDDIEYQIQNLEREVETSIRCEDTKQFVILEKKITILYGDLVMVQIENHTPLSERREAFERRLIGCNNQIKKCRRRLTKRFSESAQSITPKIENGDDLDKIQQHVSELAVEALTFNGVKTDKRYKELEQILERYWTKLYAIDLFTDEERHKRDATVERTKNVLQELRKRAEQNEPVQKLGNIEQQIESLKKEVGNFDGNSTDPEYTRLDQDARRLWADLNEIEEAGEQVRSSKTASIANIKSLLKELSQNTKKRESLILEEIQQKQLIKQVEEFHNHWNQLNHNLSERSILESSATISIIEMLETVLEGLKKRTRALNVLENRKSNASLVITKVTDGSPLYVKYKSAPDLVPQQLGIPESAVPPPLNKTKIISEMHRIGNDAKALLTQIKQVNNLKDADRESYENKLNQCRLNLDALEYNKKSDTIESNRRRVTKLIEEGFKALNEKIAKELSKSSSALEIMDVDAEIQYWRQQIKNFSGTDKDKQYEKIKNGLAESLMKLQVLGDKQASKQENIQQIQQHHQELETKLAENQAKVKCAEIKRQTSQEIKITVEQVQKLKAQVDRFTGIYQGILYRQIEGNLRTCLGKLEVLDTRNDERLDNAKSQTKQKVQKYLAILEEKSSKPVRSQEGVQTLQKLQDSNILKEKATYQMVYSQELNKVQKQQPQRASEDLDLPHHRINAVREELVVIKEKVEAFNGRYKDGEFLAIQKDVQECLGRLKSINDGGNDSVASSKAQYVDYIEKLQQYFEEKTLAAESGDEV